MKKLLILTLLIPLLSFSSSNISSKVYICTGKYAKSYHKTTKCKGMKACKGSIKTITFKEAEDMRRTPCGYCYGKKKEDKNRK